MREIVAEICGEDRALRATFAASKEIASKVGDPLMISREAAAESILLAQGINYVPKWRFTVENIPAIIHVGLKSAGSDLKLSEVQDWTFDVGFSHAQGVAAQYLAAIITPGPKESVSDGKPSEKE